LYLFSSLDGECNEERLRELCASPVEEAFIYECKQFFDEKVRPAARGYDEEDCCDVIIEAAGADLKGFEPDTLLELLKYVYLNKAYEGNKKRFVQHLARNGQIVKELFAALESTASALADIEAQRDAAKNSDQTYRQVLETLSGLEQQERELLESYEQTRQTLTQELPAPTPAPVLAPHAQSSDTPEGVAPKKRGRRPKDAPVPPDEPPEEDAQLLV
jgi:hypothetical protein